MFVADDMNIQKTTIWTYSDKHYDLSFAPRRRKTGIMSETNGNNFYNMAEWDVSVIEMWVVISYRSVWNDNNHKNGTDILFHRHYRSGRVYWEKHKEKER